MNIDAAGLDHLCTFLNDQESPGELLTDILEYLSSSNTQLCKLSHITEAIAHVQRTKDPYLIVDDDSFFDVQSAFETPFVHFRSDIKRFEISQFHQTILGDASSKREYFLERYSILYQRLLRSPAFSQAKTNSGIGINAHNNEITPIASLLGSTGRKLLFGILRENPDPTSQVSSFVEEQNDLRPMKELNLVLEDPSGSIPLSFERISYVNEGFFTEGSFVIVDGEKVSDKEENVELRGMEPEGSSSDGFGLMGGADEKEAGTMKGIQKGIKKGTFLVNGLFFPPTEKRSESIEANPELLKGWRTKGLQKGTEKSEKRENADSKEAQKVQKESQVSSLDAFNETQLVQVRSASSSFIVVLSDVYLDEPRVTQKLSILLDGYNDSESIPPKYIVLMGNFSSQSVMAGSDDEENLKKQFEYLAVLISKYTNIAQKTTFVFIPGPRDLTPTPSILPRRSLFSSLFAPFKKYNINFINTTNPCRMTVYDQTILFFRDDITSKLRRVCHASASISHPLSQSLSHSSDSSSENLQFQLESQCSITDNSNASSSSQPSSASVSASSTSLVTTSSSSQIPTAFEIEESKAQQEFVISQFMLRTLFDQATLAPLPFALQPIMWSHADSLSLYPLPHFVVIGDSWPEFNLTYQDTKCINPGSFSQAFSFFVYYPSTGEWEPSQID
ncbi:DNA polymerase epsilon subunit 2 [Monocercomonoides exilis]|uniref:DNA polymerase epsilon subunit 2 n=1 Tax=Monocercomonoides exilis TaxID=2049356 RepID=UPI00355AA93E|nr:DNA polymerase epsilon subunit 2 [Monocercomonoides exilis]|eukprot:MONOS_11098.1-p1 / transcript=MONOS_11098.1 / gene=MONOS_11098 / organism=Monocercomonoides_exilis_PA203 / gene_product=DNA polymerase epsilon subunit 2 / transcript_product=DNA polymerase epsilon subunit 2 / location=Mono_scaffold00538:9513-12707(+) / protein_length=675 / sequence_SO=supercontig / SO=protein_coding / is_pseudo=false